MTTAPDAVHRRVRGRCPFEHDQDTAHTRKRPKRPELPPFTGEFALAKPRTPQIPSEHLTELMSHGEFTVKRRTLPVAAALAATAALLLTACGSGDDKASDNDKIAGADQGSATPTESASASGAPAEDKPDGVDVSLPKGMDLTMVFDWDKPKDKNQAAAMEDTANFLRAIYRGIDKRTTNDAAVVAYSTGDGLHYAKTQINAWIKGGWTATGTERHYDVSTRSATNGQAVEVAFCVDSSKFYGKEIKTGKVLKTEPSLADFDYFKIIMVESPTADSLWQASKVYVETKAAKCQ